jgi:GxxExxY protein
MGNSPQISQISQKIMQINEITYLIIGAAYEVHKSLGPGLLESTYQVCLVYLLEKKGLQVECQKPLPVIFEGVHLNAGYRIDLLIEDTVIVEIKSIEMLAPVHHAQLLTYLRLSGKKIGLLINFNVSDLKGGIKRIIN